LKVIFILADHGGRYLLVTATILRPP